MCFVPEPDVSALHFSEPLNKAELVGVDQDVANRRVLEQGLDRTESDHFGDHFVAEDGKLFLVERDTLRADIIGDIRVHLSMQLLWRKFLQQSEVELVDDAAMQLEFLVQQCRPPRDQVAIESINIGLRPTGLLLLHLRSRRRRPIGLHRIAKQKTHALPLLPPYSSVTDTRFFGHRHPREPRSHPCTFASPINHSTDIATGPKNSSNLGHSVKLTPDGSI